MQKIFNLIKKEKLTFDVYKLTFETQEILEIIPWQFITFLLPISWFGRAYSVFNCIENKVEFIIKRLENGRWWSKELCDYDVWKTLKWIWPVGHFILKDNSKNSLFIWTWTWIVPLFFMIDKNLDFEWKKYLLWWNRNEKDLYLLDELKRFKNKWVWIDICLSQENNKKYFFWRITEKINLEFIKDFSRFYICWNPNMVNEVVEKLLFLWINKENIFTEKY